MGETTEISVDVLKQIGDLRTASKNIDVHINDNDNSSTRRQKDMAFGESMAYEKVCELLGIEEGK